MTRSRALAAASFAAVALACGGQEYRCIVPGGISSTECSSTPANCPVTIPHSDTPRCPSGATMVPKDDDHCTRHLACVD